MEKKRLGEIMTFSLGKNPTRIKEVGINMYLPEDFEQDLYSISQLYSDSYCFINLINQKQHQFH